MVSDKCYTTDEFEKCYSLLNKFGKPIKFCKVSISIKNEIEKTYDLSNCEIIYYKRHIALDKYLKIIKSDIKNLHIHYVTIDLESILEKEFEKQLYFLIRDKRVSGIWFDYDKKKKIIPISVEYASYINAYNAPLVNPQNTENILFFPHQEVSYMENVSCDTLFTDGCLDCKNVSCKNIFYYIGSISALRRLNKNKIDNLESIWLGIFPDEFNKIAEDEEMRTIRKNLADKNISLRFFDEYSLSEIGASYIEYLREKDIFYLSGYINVKNKPAELSNEEWDHVLILKQKVKSIISEIKKISKEF